MIAVKYIKRIPVARPSRAARGLKPAYVQAGDACAYSRAALTGRAWIETPHSTPRLPACVGRAALTGRAWIETAWKER